MSEIKLTFINNANDSSNPDIIIFQKNEAASFSELAVAWTVIKNCGAGGRYPFSFAVDTYIAVSDTWGNMSPQLLAKGQCFSFMQDPSGNVLKLAGNASAPNEIEVVNGLASAAINANIYRSGRLLAAKTGIAPGRKAAFAFQPTIWIGMATQAEEGQTIDPAILSQINTEISLIGIKSADIVLTGGGSGSTAKPLVFVLENVAYA